MHALMTVSEKQGDQRASEKAVKKISATGNSAKRQWEYTGGKEKRTYKRINVHIDIRFFYGGHFITGRVTHLSANGMFIHTPAGLPLKAEFDVLFKVKNRIVKVPVTIAGRRRSDHLPPGIGVTVLDTSGDYLQLLMQSNRVCLT